MLRFAPFLLLPALASADVMPRDLWRFHDAFSGRLESAWDVLSGEWTIENGSLIGCGTRGGPDPHAILRLRTPLRRATELEIEVEPLLLGGGGFQIQFGGQKFFHYVDVTGIWPPYVTTNEVRLKPEGVTKIRLRRIGNRYEFHIDGKLALQKEGEPAEGVPEDEIRLWTTLGNRARFDNLVVK